MARYPFRPEPVSVDEAVLLLRPSAFGAATSGWTAGDLLDLAEATSLRLVREYSDDEPRDDHGRWTSGGGGGVATAQTPEEIGRDLIAGRPTSCSASQLADVMAVCADAPAPVNLENLHVDDMGHGNLFDHSATDLSRVEMPQVPLKTADDVQAFTDRLDAHGLSYTMENVPPADLTATQNEMNAQAIGQMVSIGYDPNQSVLITSQDGDVLDGHHRFAVGVIYQAANPSYTTPIVRVGTDINTLLGVAYEHSQALGIEARAMGVGPRMR